ncbi:MAG: hypothetical protein LAP85_19085 [Acidobacteriia bacterium]|nr:hypothetical protein [Terriglobia bacterium]
MLKSVGPSLSLVIVGCCLAFLAGASLLVYLNRAQILLGSQHSAPLTDIRKEHGFAYTAMTHHPELSSHEQPSNAQVLEDGRPLPGPANSLHEDIRTTGKGRYSFWHAYVYFATSDNTDPRTNDRVYTLRYTTTVGAAWASLLYASTILLCAVAAILVFRTDGIYVLFARLKTPVWIILLVLFLIAGTGLAVHNYENASRIYLAVAALLIFVLAGAATLGTFTFFCIPPLVPLRAALRAVLLWFAFFSMLCWLLWSNPVVTRLYGVFALSPWLLRAALPGALTAMLCFLALEQASRRRVWEQIVALSSHKWFGKIRARHVALVLILFMALLSTLHMIMHYWDTSPWMDSNGYDTLAHELALGHGFHTQFYMPLYVVWLAGLFYFFGHFYFVVQLANILLVLATIAIFYAAMRAWTDSTAVALLTALFLATSMSIISVYVHVSQIETFNELLVAVNFYIFVMLLKKIRPEIWFLWGLSASLLLLSRMQNFGLLLGELVVFLVMMNSPRRAGFWTSLKQKVVPLCVAFLGLLLPLAAWGVRNRIVEGQFRITTTAAVWQLALGNHPDTRGGVDYRSYYHLQAEYDRKYPDPKEKDAAYRRDGIRFLIESPRRTLYNFWTRTKVFLDLLEPGFWRNRPTVWATEWNSFVVWHLQPILALTAVLFLIIFHRGRLLWVSLLLVILYLLPFLPFPALESRIRFPIDHVFLLGIAAMIRYAATEQRTKLACSWPPAPVSNLVGRRGLLSYLRHPDEGEPRAPDLHLYRRVVAVVSVVIVLILCRSLIGAPNARRLLKAAGATKVAQVSSDTQSPGTRPWEDLARSASKDGLLGATVEMHATVSNQGWPSEWIAQLSPNYFPEFCRDAGNGCYQVSVVWRQPQVPGEPRMDAAAQVSVSYKGALVDRRLREGDRAWILGRITQIRDFDAYESPYPAIYIEVIKAKKIE